MRLFLYTVALLRVGCIVGVVTVDTFADIPVNSFAMLLHVILLLLFCLLFVCFLFSLLVLLA